MVEFVRHVDNVVAAHHRVMEMNFIPGGYTMPAAVWKARSKAKSQIVASRAAESGTEPPSPADKDKFRDAQDDEDLPPSPEDEDLPPSPTDEDLPPLPVEEDLPPSCAEEDLPPTRLDEDNNLSPHQDAGRPLAQETHVVPTIESPPTRDPKMLKLDIQRS